MGTVSIGESVAFTGSLVSDLTNGRVPVFSRPPGTFADSSLFERTDDIVSDKKIKVPAGSLAIGEALELSEGRGDLIFVDLLDASVSFSLNVPFDSLTGSSLPSYFDFGAQFTVNVNTDDSETLTDNPLTFQLPTTVTAPNVRLIDKITIRAGSSMTNFRIKITDNATGLALRYIPSEAAFEGRTPGLDLITGETTFSFVSNEPDTTQDFNLGFVSFFVKANQTLDVEIIADSIDLLGNLAGVPFIVLEVNDGPPVEIPVVPALTEGSILFANSLGSLTEDNDNLFWDDTNNRLGIGTPTPAERVVIFNGANTRQIAFGSPTSAPTDPCIMTGRTDGTLGRIFQRQSTTNDVFVGDIDASGGDLHLRDNGATGLTMSGGDIGIGTTAALARVHSQRGTNAVAITPGQLGAAPIDFLLEDRANNTDLRIVLTANRTAGSTQKIIQEMWGNGFGGPLSKAAEMRVETSQGNASGNINGTFLFLVSDNSGTPTEEGKISKTGMESPVMTGTQTGGGSSAALRSVSTGPGIEIRETDASANNKSWDFLAEGGRLTCRAVNDANTAALSWIEIDRTGTVIDTVSFPNGDLKFTSYPDTRDDGTLLNMLGTDADGNLLSGVNDATHIGGNFVDTTNQTIAVVSTGQSVTFDTNSLINGLTHPAASDTFTIDTTGVYNIVVAPQMTQGAGSAQVEFWIEKNGTNIANSNAQESIAANSEALPLLRWKENFVATDTFKIIWASDSLNTTLANLASTYGGPNIPSIMLGVTRSGI